VAGPQEVLVRRAGTASTSCRHPAEHHALAMVAGFRSPGKRAVATWHGDTPSPIRHRLGAVPDRGVAHPGFPRCFPWNEDVRRWGPDLGAAP